MSYRFLNAMSTLGGRNESRPPLNSTGGQNQLVTLAEVMALIAENSKTQAHEFHQLLLQQKQDAAREIALLKSSVHSELGALKAENRGLSNRVKKLEDLFEEEMQGVLHGELKRVISQFNGFYVDTKRRLTKLENPVTALGVRLEEGDGGNGDEQPVEPVVNVDDIHDSPNDALGINLEEGNLVIDEQFGVDDSGTNFEDGARVIDEQFSASVYVEDAESEADENEAETVVQVNQVLPSTLTTSATVVALPLTQPDHVQPTTSRQALALTFTPPLLEPEPIHHTRIQRMLGFNGNLEMYGIRIPNCGNCRKFFASYDTLHEHEVANKCHEPSRSRAAMKGTTHYIVHVNQLTGICSCVCGFQRPIQKFIFHLRYYLTEPRYQCEICHANFVYKSEKDRHLLTCQAFPRRILRGGRGRPRRVVREMRVFMPN